MICGDVDAGAPGHAGFALTLSGSVPLQCHGRGDSSRTAAPSGWRSWGCGCLAAAALCVTACAVGPDYHKPTVQMPESFKEGTEWQRAQANPQGALSSTWWVEYHDEQLSQLVDAALQANQSIVAAEAAYRVARATVSASVAALYPTVSANVSATRAEAGAGAAATELPVGVSHFVTATASASWELDLWGQTRRQIESSKAGAQASDAQRAGQRLSIAASVASDYFALRQADSDIGFLKQQQQVNADILTMTQGGYAQGAASGDDVLVAQDTLEAVIAALQATLTLREQYEHAIAVLVGVPPGGFSIQPRQGYVFVTPAVPLSVPSQLLERRYDVVTAERIAASANAKIGVAQAAFFPTLDLSAEGGYEHNQFAHLFSLPNRFWTLGPTLAETIFDGGARTAAVREARATYDEDVANYRQTVLAAFQSVEDSLSSWNHLQQQAQAYANIYQRNQKLFDNTRAQREVGTASEQNLLSEQLTLLLAKQNLQDTQAALTQSSVALIKNLGGGWQWDETRKAAVTSTSMDRRNRADPAAGLAAQ
jgi:NodT family efflux transporter outer membrane factor (OMF) lipoprotein